MAVASLFGLGVLERRIIHRYGAGHASLHESAGALMLMGPLVSVVFGVVAGLLAFVASKIIKQRAARLT